MNLSSPFLSAARSFIRHATALGVLVFLSYWTIKLFSLEISKKYIVKSKICEYNSIPFYEFSSHLVQRLIHLFILLFFYLAFSQEDYFSAIERVVPVTIWLGLASLSVEILKALKRYLVLFRCKCLYLLLYCIQSYCHLAECSHIYPAHPVSLKHSSNQNFWLN